MFTKKSCCIYIFFNQNTFLGIFLSFFFKSKTEKMAYYLLFFVIIIFLNSGLWYYLIIKYAFYNA